MLNGLVQRIGETRSLLLDSVQSEEKTPANSQNVARWYPFSRAPSRHENRKPRPPSHTQTLHQGIFQSLKLRIWRQLRYWDLWDRKLSRTQKSSSRLRKLREQRSLKPCRNLRFQICLIRWTSILQKIKIKSIIIPKNYKKDPRQNLKITRALTPELNCSWIEYHQIHQTKKNPGSKAPREVRVPSFNLIWAKE